MAAPEAVEQQQQSLDKFKWKMLPRRRHSIQTVTSTLTSKSPLKEDDLANEDEQRQIGPSKQSTRRPSLAESIQSMTKTVSK